MLGAGDELREVVSGGGELFDLLLHGGQNLEEEHGEEGVFTLATDAAADPGKSAPTWKRERTDGWNTKLVLSRKERRSGCGNAASWARIPVSSRLTWSELLSMFSMRDSSTLTNGPAQTEVQLWVLALVAGTPGHRTDP